MFFLSFLSTKLNNTHLVLFKYKSHTYACNLFYIQSPFLRKRKENNDQKLQKIEKLIISTFLFTHDSMSLKTVYWLMVCVSHLVIKALAPSSIKPLPNNDLLEFLECGYFIFDLFILLLIWKSQMSI